MKPSDQRPLQDRAYYRRKDHAHIEAMQNCIIASIVDQCLAALPDDLEEKEKRQRKKEIELPAKARTLISALQAAHGGGVVRDEMFERSYLTLGRLLQYTGSDEAIRSRVRNSINLLDEWQYRVSFRLFTIIKGGEHVIENGEKLFHPNGDPIRTKTKFIDHVKFIADQHVQQAKKTDLWAEHPGRAMEAQAVFALKDLPKLGTRAESGAVKETRPLPLNQYEDQQEAKICDFLERRADEIDLRGGDSDLWLERLEVKIKRIRDSRRKTRPARQDYASLSIFEENMPSPLPGKKNLTQSTSGD